MSTKITPDKAGEAMAEAVKKEADTDGKSKDEVVGQLLDQNAKNNKPNPVISRTTGEKAAKPISAKIKGGKIQPIVKVKNDSAKPPKAKTPPKTELKEEIVEQSPVAPYEETEQSRLILAERDRLANLSGGRVGSAGALQLSHYYQFSDKKTGAVKHYGAFLGTGDDGKLLVQELDKGEPSKQVKLAFDVFDIIEISRDNVRDFSFLK